MSWKLRIGPRKKSKKKKPVWVKTLDSDRVSDIGRDDDIWPEMGPWGVLESFCTPIWYFSAFRSIFMKFQKMQFLTFWIMVFGHFRAGRIFYGSKIGQISPGTNFYESSPFPKKMGPVRSGLSLTYSKICGYMPNPENCIFCWSVVFVVFVAFLGNTMLFFKKFEIWTFSQYIHCWANSQ